MVTNQNTFLSNNISFSLFVRALDQTSYLNLSIYQRHYKAITATGTAILGQLFSLIIQDNMSSGLEKGAGVLPFYAYGRGTFSSTYEHHVNQNLHEFEEAPGQVHDHKSQKHDKHVKGKAQRGPGWWMKRVILPILAVALLCSIIPIGVATSHRTEQTNKVNLRRDATFYVHRHEIVETKLLPQTAGIQTRSGDIFPFFPVGSTSISAAVTIPTQTSIIVSIPSINPLLVSYPTSFATVTLHASVDATLPSNPFPTIQRECSVVTAATAVGIAYPTAPPYCSCKNGGIFSPDVVEGVDGSKQLACAIPPATSSGGTLTTTAPPTSILASVTVAPTSVAATSTALATTSTAITTLSGAAGFCGIKGESCGLKVRGRGP